MKKFLFISSLSLIIIALNTSCKKDENLKSVSNIIYTQDQPPDKWRLISCAYYMGGEYYSGAACVISDYAQCLQQTECFPIPYNGGYLPLPDEFPIDWGFTEDEQIRWRNGEDVIQNSDEFIDNHYKFFEDMFELGITINPDTLKRYN